MAKRIEWIDMAKGMGIVLVVVGHTFTSLWPLILYIFAFHMPLFFYIAGATNAEKITFDNAKKQDGITVFIHKKWKGLIRPYFLGSALAISLQVIMNGTDGLSSKLIDTFSFQGISVFWFLPAMFVSSVLFEAEERYINNKVVKAILFVISLLLPVFAGPYIINISLNKPVFITVLLNLVTVLLRGLLGLAFMRIGFVLHRVYIDKISCKITTKKGKMSAASISLALLLILWFLSQKNVTNMRALQADNVILFYVNAMLGCIGICLLSESIPLVKPLAFFGRNSLIVMIIHLDFYVIYAAQLVGNKIGSLIPVKGVYYVVSSLLIVLALWTGCLLINPILKKLQSI